jgi:NCAIR mutase (PurE)-related protein
LEKKKKMDQDRIKELLINVKNSETSVEDALWQLRKLPFEDIGFAKLDHHRHLRNGYPEVIYSEGKNLLQIKMIVSKMLENNSNILATRANRETFEAICEISPDASYFEDARIVFIKKNEIQKSEKIIAIVSAGTSDMSVAEEAAVTAECMGNKVDRLYDVGVAGIHRLFAHMERIMEANVVIVVAGMEGALASVVGGMVDKPVVAVPTSIGYGASFGGVSALLTMLNSCASGIGVVNIDNGFGAGFLASTINKL